MLRRERTGREVMGEGIIQRDQEGVNVDLRMVGVMELCSEGKIFFNFCFERTKSSREAMSLSATGNSERKQRRNCAKKK